jgi:hypothetical protein
LAPELRSSFLSKAGGSLPVFSAIVLSNILRG